MRNRGYKGDRKNRPPRRAVFLRPAREPVKKGYMMNAKPITFRQIVSACLLGLMLILSSHRSASANGNEAPVITEGGSVFVAMPGNGFPDKFALTLNATDAEDHTLTWSIQTQAGNGTATATGDGNSKVIAYAPTLNFSGADSFVVRVTDQLGAFDDITVNVTVSAGGDFPTFVDVPMANSAWSYIESIYYAGITGGCSTNPLAYCPNSSVTRAQMAIFLLRGMYGQAYTPPPATGTVFADVPLTHSAAAWIEQLAAEGITGGCGNGNYCPSSPVTRAQMAIFLLRAKYGDDYVPPAASGTEFLDVPIGHSAAAWIEQLAAEGITGGCGGGNYCPNKSVTRAQMAIFIQRTFDLARP
ncbi:MAG: S-layer homology domain-containing protein [Anaerolineales bacterium]|nr:S-layer homology domain-containing protein [Anaerolineales bacterium]